MGFLESLRDRELRGLYKARKLIESADLHLANGRMPEAKSDLVKAQEILFTDVSKESPHSKDYTDILSTMSGIQLKAELYDDSIRSADKALTISPNAIVAITMKAKALAAKGAYPDAIALLDKAISLNNNDHMLFLEKGKILCKAGKQQEAVLSLKRAVDIDPSDIEQYDILRDIDDKSRWSIAKVEALLHLKRMDDAMNAIDDVLAQDARNTDVLLVKASILLGSMRLDDANKIYDTILEISPTISDANLGKARTLNALGDLDSSVKYYRESLRSDVERKEVWTEVGLVLEHLNRLEEAEKVYDKALELDPI